MTRKTLKAGVVGKLGPRYGVRIRRRVQEVEETQKRKHACPRCMSQHVQRVSAGVWRCRRCNLVFAGGAYRPIVTTAIKREVALKPEEGEAVEEVSAEEKES